MPGLRESSSSAGTDPCGGVETKLLGLVPARSGSKEIPGKNIKTLNGLPLMVYAIRNIQGVLGKCFVSTDSEEYAQIAEQYGAIILERPPELATDDARLIDVLAFHGKGYDGVLCQPPTAPFVKPETLLRLLKFPCAMTVSKAREHPSLMVGKEPVYPRQRRAPALFLNGCASFRGKALLERCDLKTNALDGAHLVEIAPPESLNIDDWWDWSQAEWIIGNTTCSTSTIGASKEGSTTISAR